jgi:hypothetical protein
MFFYDFWGNPCPFAALKAALSPCVRLSSRQSLLILVGPHRVHNVAQEQEVPRK